MLLLLLSVSYFSLYVLYFLEIFHGIFYYHYYCGKSTLTGYCQPDTHSPGIHGHGASGSHRAGLHTGNAGGGRRFYSCPGTIANQIQNFFSTEFVKNDSNGLRVSRQVWIMVAVAVPMTVCVLVFWRLWLRYEFFRLRSLRLARRSLKALVKAKRSKDEDPEMKV